MQSTVTFIAIIAAIVIAAVMIGNVNTKRAEAALLARLKKEFGSVPSKRMSDERYKRVPGYFEKHCGKNDFFIDDITWNDLEMDRIYKRIDSTESAAGEEYLYYLLKSPAVSPGREPNEEFLSYLADGANEKTRIALQEELIRLGHTGKYSVYDYLDLLDEAKVPSRGKEIFHLVLPFLCLGIMFADPGIGLILLVASFIWNMISYTSQKGETGPYFVTIRYVLRLLDCAGRLGKISCPPIQKDLESLQETEKSFASFRRGSFLITTEAGSGSGNPADLILDYIRMLFHVDLLKFGSQIRELKKRRDDIDAMVTALGKIDAEISVASFRKSLPFYCTPHFTGRAVLDAEDLYHPLLENPVPNSIRAERPVLLTGSNASGKSTFLKSAALAALLSQAIGTCCAGKYEGARFRIYSSMALRDSITSKESYFMVEIRSLKRIADASAKKDGAPVLCFIDEVLRGTNTVERIAASTEILKALAGSGALCFAATHDIELSTLLEEDYDNYHFEEELEDKPGSDKKDVVFSYRIHTGSAKTRNAIRLLGAAGFDPGITDRAEKRAEDFEKTGQWR